MDRLIKKYLCFSNMYAKVHCLKEEIVICTVRDSPSCCGDPIYTPLGWLFCADEHFCLRGHVCILVQHKADRAFHQSNWINPSVKYWFITSKWNLSVVCQSFIPLCLQQTHLPIPADQLIQRLTVVLLLWFLCDRVSKSVSWLVLALTFLCLVIQQQTCALLLINMFEILSWPTAPKKKSLKSLTAW